MLYTPNNHNAEYLYELNEDEEIKVNYCASTAFLFIKAAKNVNNKRKRLTKLNNVCFIFYMLDDLKLVS